MIPNTKKDIAWMVTCMPLISSKSSIIHSFSGKLRVNSEGNVLPITFALAGDMLDVFMLRNTMGIACIVLQYLIKNTINVTIRRMLQRKVTCEHMIDADCHAPAYFKYSVNFFWFLS